MVSDLLVAIDASEAAACAVERAAELAEQLEARIVLLHVLNPASVVVAAELMQVYQPTFEELNQSGERLLREARQRIGGATEVRTLMLEGNPATRIIRTAVDLPADLIFIGTDSRGRLAHFLLGSTADAVIRRAPCPVVTVCRAPKQQNPLAGESLFANTVAER
jgi:nucleotide-binding universal stress UspA family protein